MPFPTKPTSPGQFAVLVTAGAVLCCLLGLLAIFLAVRGQAADPEAARSAMQIGLVLMGLGLAAFVGLFVARRWIA